ncbi:MAG TPA: molybdate ABC transporter substrate-binding protein [Steroidobacteraceae bacterium]|jgi:molybdate transport system substrate-binding protein|nr:molybdate ABC transporter substrate-binding protein [Steroidobacteraceae bacterium]
MKTAFRSSATLPCALALVLLLWLQPRPVSAAQLHVAVAANFLGTLQKLAPAFARATGNTVVPSAGATGQLYAQITQGAPFDVFLSADTERPQRLQAQHLIVAGSRFTYAVGTVVLWSPRAGAVHGGGEALRAGGFRYIGVANPKDAPYGAAAQQVLTALGLWNRLNQDKKIVVGENITQTWQFAASGNVDMAFVALSQLIDASGKIGGSYWLPPQSMYQSIDQDGVILASSHNQGAAQAFTRWLRTAPAAAAIIKAAGYHLAD